ncbi:hypothetical protein JCM12294_48770 [Desulfocicer niacini]
MIVGFLPENKVNLLEAGKVKVTAMRIPVTKERMPIVMKVAIRSTIPIVLFRSQLAYILASNKAAAAAAEEEEEEEEESKTLSVAAKTFNFSKPICFVGKLHIEKITDKQIKPNKKLKLGTIWLNRK